ncbi:MAG: MlaD family protein [Candidatus Methylomirabilia bacterium]
MAPARSQVALKFRVGLFLAVSLVVFSVLGIMLVGPEGLIWTSKYELVAEYEEVGGLIPGAIARLAGVQIGRVSDVRLPEVPGGKVRVTLSIARQFGDRIRKDSVARIETQGLLGDKVVEISLGSPTARALNPGETIATREAVEFNRIVGQGAEVLKSVAALSATLRTAVETLDTGEALEDLAATLKSARRIAERVEKGATAENLSGTLESARRIAEQVEKGSGWLHVLLYEEPEALRRLNALLGSTQRLLADGQRGESAVSVLLSAESGRAARQLLRSVESLGLIAEGAREGNSLLAALLFDPKYKSVMEDLRVVAQNFRDVSEKLAGGRSVMGSFLQDEADGPLGEAARDFKAALANLRAITDRLAAGDGTIGGLLQDPTVYENLAAFLEGAQRSVLLRYLIRSTIQSGNE